MNTHRKVISSPCIRNCCLDQAEICLGCFRSLSEIIGWGQADETTRRIILENTSRRRDAYREKYNVYRNSLR
ncbi:DUF1289 domain-containing protein [Methylosarcina fibrata]|uniref:DUF1289 domain-containing protein n=1 Tax=Methylosarcina fibrata TaxID=105972 RepID=UPI0009FC7647|nr:DUF1289 domain-containing protein [Methylosarcina fibrata]